LILERSIVFTEVIEAGFKAECALFKLSLLLIAHGHVVEQLEGNVLVPVAASQVNNVKDTVRLLQ